MTHYCDNFAVNFSEGGTILMGSDNSHYIGFRSSNFQKRRLAASGRGARLEQPMVDGTQAT